MPVSLIEKLRNALRHEPDLNELRANDDFIAALREAYDRGYSVQELAHLIDPSLRAAGYPKVRAHDVAAWLGVSITTIDRTKV